MILLHFKAVTITSITRAFCFQCLSFYNSFFLLWPCGPSRARASSFTRFLDYTPRHTTFGKNPLDEWSARRTDLYRTTQNTHNRPLPDNTQHSQQTSTWQHTTLTTNLYLTTHNTHNRPLPDKTQHSQETNFHALGGIWSHSLSK
jgi:hypothetical protein